MSTHATHLPMPVRVGTAGFALATTEAGHVIDELVNLTDLPFEPKVIQPVGATLDANSVHANTGVVSALREALLQGAIQIAVHTLADLPTEPADGLTVASILERTHPADVICGRDGLNLDTLPAGARVGTDSPLRGAALFARRPDLDIVHIQGELRSQLARLQEDLDAIVTSHASLEQLRLTDHITQVLDPRKFLPAPAQGALALEIAPARLPETSEVLFRALARLNHLPTQLAVQAERGLLTHILASTKAPVGAFAQVRQNAEGRWSIELAASVTRSDGSRALSLTKTTRLGDVTELTAEASSAAKRLGQDLAQLLVDQGAGTFS